MVVRKMSYIGSFDAEMGRVTTERGDYDPHYRSTFKLNKRFDHFNGGFIGLPQTMGVVMVKGGLEQRTHGKETSSLAGHGHTYFN